MSKISHRTILPRVEYIRYVYEKSDSLFENFGQPIAVYERGGKITKATIEFRELACVADIDIQRGDVNIFKCLNDEHAHAIDAAREVWGNILKIVNDVACPLRPRTEYARLLLSDYRNAVFFPISYLDFKRDEVDCCGVLLIRDPIKEAENG